MCAEQDKNCYVSTHQDNCQSIKALVAFQNVLKIFILNQQHLWSRKQSRQIRKCKSNNIVQLALNLVIISKCVDLFQNFINMPIRVIYWSIQQADILECDPTANWLPSDLTVSPSCKTNWPKQSETTISWWTRVPTWLLDVCWKKRLTAKVLSALTDLIA